jgi:methyl-accepting chemotaxis protein
MSKTKIDKRSVEQLASMFNSFVSMRSKLQHNLSQVDRIVQHHTDMTPLDVSLAGDDLSNELNEIVCNLQKAEEEVMHMMDKVRYVARIPQSS